MVPVSTWEREEKARHRSQWLRNILAGTAIFLALLVGGWFVFNDYTSWPIRYVLTGTDRCVAERVLVGEKEVYLTPCGPAKGRYHTIEVDRRWKPPQAI